MTTNQVLLGVGLILALAASSQVLASLLKIPAIIVLLPAASSAGAITSDVNPQHLLGSAFQPLVSLASAQRRYSLRPGDIERPAGRHSGEYEGHHGHSREARLGGAHGYAGAAR